HVASHLPGDGCNVQPRGLGKMLRLADALAALARRLDRHIEIEEGNPWGQSVRGAEVVSRCQAKRRVGMSACGSHAGLGDAPLSPRYLEGGMIVKCNERERLQVPRFRRPVLQFVAEIRFDEFFQTGVVEPAR